MPSGDWKKAVRSAPSVVDSRSAASSEELSYAATQHDWVSDDVSETDPAALGEGASGLLEADRADATAAATVSSVT